MSAMNKDWDKVGSGDLAYDFGIRKKFAPIAHVKAKIWILEEIGENEIDMDELLQGLTRLQVLKGMSFPPLYSERDFDWIDGFMTIEKDDFEGPPGMSFNTIEVYLERKVQTDVLEEFRILNERLESLGHAKGLI